MLSYLLFMLPAMLLSLWATAAVQSRFAHYRRVPVSRGLSGAEAARILLNRAGLAGVAIERTGGLLSDHYDPSQRVLRLSPDVFSGRSVAAVGVAAHEAGHAIQHAQAYAPLQIRSAIVPAVSVSSNISWLLILGGMLLGSAGLLKIGVALFSAVVFFTLITLPVEFDASRRAKLLLREYGLVSATEAKGVEKVLNAAAMTYVAAAVSSVATLLWYLLQMGLIGGDD